MTHVITAVGGRGEAELVRALEATAGYTLVRRCADLAELLSAAAAGVGEVALVSAELRALDRTALADLAAHGVRVAGVVAPGDQPGEQRLRRLGVAVVVSTDLPSPDLDDALDALRAPGAPGAPGTPGTLGPNGSEPSQAEGIGIPLGPGSEAHDPSLVAPGGAGESGGEGPDNGARRPGRVLAVWGPTGAPGRSTLALNLAAELADVAPTLLIDADTYAASQAQALGLLDEAPGVAAAARAAELGTLDLPALARLAPQVVPGLRILTGLPAAERWTELRAASMAQVLHVARQLASFVVVDCGFAIEDDEELSYDTLAPRRNAATLTALEGADEVLVVGRADPVGLQRLVRAVQDVAPATRAPRVVVVNQVRAAAVGQHPERRIAEALTRFAGIDDLAFVPHDTETLDGAMLAGQVLREFAPHSAVRTAVAGLASRYAVPSPARRGRRRLRS